MVNGFVGHICWDASEGAVIMLELHALPRFYVRDGNQECRSRVESSSPWELDPDLGVDGFLMTDDGTWGQQRRHVHCQSHNR